MEHAFDRDYWDDIWSSDRAKAMGTSDPNPYLVNEVMDLSPGTALEAGCGAGAEAVWLASRGWTVTGADIAKSALERAERRASEAGVAGRTTWIGVDLSTWRPERDFDLVTTHYAHPAIPQLEFYDRLATWVAPRGTLFIVGHLHHHHGEPADGPPEEATATAAAIVRRLDTASWVVITAEERRRTMTGPGGITRQIDDVVVRAQRR